MSKDNKLPHLQWRDDSAGITSVSSSRGQSAHALGRTGGGHPVPPRSVSNQPSPVLGQIPEANSSNRPSQEPVAPKVTES